MTATKAETKPETAIAALVAAQKAMPRGIAPDKKNPHFKSDYVTLAAISEAVLPCLHENGLAVTCSVTNGSEPARMVATLYHVSGESLEFSVPLGAPSMTDAQKVGSAITYARRQLLGMISGIAPDADDDGNKAAPKPATTPSEDFSREVASTEQAAALLSDLKDCSTPIDLAAIASRIATAKADLLASDVKRLKTAYVAAKERIDAE